jgi:hypothetical protein
MMGVVESDLKQHALSHHFLIVHHLTIWLVHHREVQSHTNI